jgi:ribonuclease BN (tRNA processing enzyme)
MSYGTRPVAPTPVPSVGVAERIAAMQQDMYSGIQASKIEEQKEQISVLMQRLSEREKEVKKYVRGYELLKEIVAYIGDKIVGEELPNCVKDAAVLIAEKELGDPVAEELQGLKYPQITQF